MRFLVTFAVCLWLSITFSAAPTQALQLSQAKQEVCTLPYEQASNGAPLISLRLNDTETARFVVDTGSNGSTISDRLVTRLALQPRDNQVKAGQRSQDETGAPIQIVFVPHLRFADVAQDNVPFLVNKAQVLKDIVGPDVDGIIGADMLKDFAVLFDFQQQQLTFWHTGIPSEELARLNMNMAYKVALTDAANKNLFTVPVSINGQPPHQATVDTGSDGTTISYKQSKSLHVQPFLAEPMSLIFIGPVAVERAQVRTVRVGSYTCTGMSVTYVSAATPATNALPPILGLDFLTQHRVLMDYKHHLMYFQPVAQTEYAFPLSDKTLTIPAAEVVLQDGNPHLFAFSLTSISCIDKPAAESIKAASSPAILQPKEMLLTSRLALKGTKLVVASFALPVVEFSKVDINIPHVEGLLGADFLNGYALRLEMAQQKATLIAPGHLGGPDYVSKSAQCLPLWGDKNGILTQLSVDGNMVTFYLDLTSPMSVLGAKALLKTLHPVATLQQIEANGTSRTLLLQEIGVEGAMWKSPKIWDRTAMNTDSNVLGLDFFSRFHVILDFPAHAMYLEPDSNFKEPPVNGSCGIGYPTLSTGKMFVRSLYSPSPAQEAGIEIGDEIVSVNGMNIDKTPIEKIFPEFKKPIGAEIVLQIRHKGEDKPHEVRLKLRKLL